MGTHAPYAGVESVRDFMGIGLLMAVVGPAVAILRTRLVIL